MLEIHTFLRKKIYLLVLFAIISVTNVQSQGEGNIWYFGQLAGLDFNSGSPVALTNSAMTASEGSSVMSDSAGNLLFYSDGLQVWNNNHQLMVNGTGLLGGWSSSQAALIVKKPCSNNLYYIFTTPHQTTSSDGFRYSIVDMNLQNGLGEVILKNVLVYQPIMEKVAAIRHKNGLDIWIVTHEWGTNKFLSFLLTEAGLTTTPVISLQGGIHFGPPVGEDNAVGVLKASADGSKICISRQFDGIHELFEFDNAMGIVSNPISFNGYDLAYGSEFSPKGNYLYINGFDSVLNHHKLYQVDLNVPWNNAALNNSVVLIDTIPQLQSPSGGPTPSGMQAGPDGKIYIGVVQGTFLSAINDPENPGTSCNFMDTSVSLSGKKIIIGLPNFINDQFLIHDILYENSCAGDSTIFLLSNIPASVIWNFGDIGSANNSSNQMQPSHIYNSPGQYTVIAVVVNFNGVSDTLVRDINIYPSVNIFNILGPDTTLCPGDTLNININIPCAQYMWNTGSTSDNIAISDSGIYWVDVFSTCGVFRDSIHVFKNSFTYAAITPQGTIQICMGDSIQLSANGVNTFQWSTGDTTSTITVSNPGIYYFTGNNHCGIAVSDSVIISLDSLPDISINGPAVYCLGNPITIEAIGGFNYTWSTGDTTATITISNPGNYFVIALNNCGVDSAFIDVFSSPVATILAQGNSAICQGDSVQLIGNGSNNYLWSNGMTDSTIYVTSPGIYYYTTNHPCGITTSDSANITILPEPIALISGSSIICDGNPITVNASGGNNFIWSTGDTTSFLIIASPGTYMVAAANECGVDSASITVASISTPIINVQGNTTICQGDSVQLAGSGSSNYQWSNGQTDSTVYVSSPGAYFYTSSTPCGTTISDTITISVDSPPIVTIKGPLVICNGISIVLHASGGTKYLWSTGDTTSSILVSTAGSYFVSSNNNCGVDSAFTIVLTEQVSASFIANPVMGFTPLIVDFSNLSTGGNIFTWNFGNGLMSNDLNPSTIFENPGIHEVVLLASTSNGCTDTATNKIIVGQSASTLFFPNGFTPNMDGLNDIFIVIGEEIGIFKAVVYNRWGAKIYGWNDINSGWNGRFQNNEEAPEGVYVIELNAVGKDGLIYNKIGTVSLIR